MILENIFIFFGILGLILIIWGIFLKLNLKRTIIYIIGGISLLIYSISKKDFVFIVLQCFFILASLIEFFKLKKK
jgi:hypothetical protein